MKTPSTLAERTREAYGSSFLLVSEGSPVRKTETLSPFFQTTKDLYGRTLLKQAGRDISISVKMKAITLGYSSAAPIVTMYFELFDGSHNYVDFGSADFDPSTIESDGDFVALTKAAVVAAVAVMGHTITADDVVFFTDLPARVFSNPSLAVNTARQASTKRDALVTASVDITASLSLTTGQRGTVALQYADDSAFTTNVKTVQSSTNGNTGTLAIGLNLGQIVSATVTGVVPASKYYRLLTTNNTGTPTYGTPAIQEVLL